MVARLNRKFDLLRLCVPLFPFVVVAFQIPGVRRNFPKHIHLIAKIVRTVAAHVVEPKY